MNLWIRSQDRTKLIKVDNISYMDMSENYKEEVHSLWNDSKGILGTYKTKERALEVLEEILQLIKKGNKNIFKINRIVDINTLVRIKNCYEKINNEEISLYDNHFELLNKKYDIEIYEMPLE